MTPTDGTYVSNLNTLDEQQVLACLIREIGKILGRTPGQEGILVDPQTRFRELGLTSLQLTGLIAWLAEQYGCALAVTAAWEHPTPLQLARHVAAVRAPRSAADAAAAGARAAGAASAPVSDPIAIVGIGCRLPGDIHRPEDLWTLLCQGRSAISEVPQARWNAAEFLDADPVAAGKMTSRWGGFLADVDRFDASFFGISPTEAEQMDPQQRLALECAWESLEDAATDPVSLRGQQVGVFIGAMWSDYARLQNGDASLIKAHTATGQDTSIISARISYALGLQGTSLTVNTACSSSLVAIHLACQSLRLGETSLALAGGVSLILSAHSSVAMTKFGALNPAGQCRSFDAAANGYVRAEGCGIVVLKPLHRALADQDRIYCVIRGSATNNDGFSNGLTAPNPKAQEAVLRAAHQNAAVEPDSIHYVEAHGPGTLLGDPIEAGALGVVLGPHHSAENPLRIGSLKSNLGHLEAAAGVAGILKVALSLYHRRLPPSLHFEQPNPHIPFAALHLKVQTTLEPWPCERQTPRAGVSSFGFGGTNAHAVLEAAPGSQVLLLPLSAQDPMTLRRRALEILDVAFQLRSAEEAAALCRAVALRSSGGGLRRALTFQGSAGLVAALSALLSTERPATAPSPARPRLVFVCPGHGWQWLGMGRLLLTEAAFFAELRACDKQVRELCGWSVLDQIVASEAHSRLQAPEVVQVLLFSVQAALGALWRSWGVEPDAVVGHSVGEVTAAYLAGVLSRRDALRVVVERSRLVAAHAAGRGAMLAVALSEGALRELLGNRNDEVVLAGWNSPGSTVLSGELDALARVEQALLARGVKTQRVNIGYASHSPQMEPLLAPLRDSLRDLCPGPAKVALRSTAEEAWLHGPECDAGYWTRNLRQPVRFQQAIAALAQAGHTVFLELSAHPVFLKSIEQTLESVGRTGQALPSGWRHEDERGSMLETLGRLYELGVSPRWSVVFASLPSLEPLPPELLSRLDEAPADAALSPLVPLSAPLPFLLSAKTPAALLAQAAQLRAHLAAHPELSLVDVAASLAVARTCFEHRAVVVERAYPQLLQSLSCQTEGSAAATAVPRKLAFLFSGQGSQRPEMGRGLYDAYPVFRAALDAVWAEFAPYLELPLQRVVFAPSGASEAALLDQTAYTQPALFALQVALFRLLASWGVTPDLLMGHSLGELTAAYLAGAMSLADACLLVSTRGRLMQELGPGGAMAAVAAPEQQVRAQLRGRETKVALAAVNAPSAVVISGDEQAVEELARKFADQGCKTTRLAVQHAFHSPRMDAMMEAFGQAAQRVAFSPPRIPIISNLTGKRVTTAELASAEYWVRHVRETVRFWQGMQTLQSEGVSTYLELGPRGVLSAIAEECCSSAPAPGALIVPTLRAERPEPETVLQALGSLHCSGHSVDWEAFFEPLGARRVALPTYPFQRRRYWLPTPVKQAADAATPGATATIDSASLYQVVWESTLARGPESPTRRTVVIGEGLRIAKALDLAHYGTLERLLQALPRMASPPGRVIVDATDGAGADTLTELHRFTQDALQLLQGWLAQPTLASCELVWLTQGAVAADAQDAVADLARAGLWGLVRSARREYPGRGLRLLDIEAKTSAEQLWQALHADAEPELAMRSASLRAPRLRVAPKTARQATARLAGRALRTDGVALITGGTGALGRLLARHLARTHGVRRLVLASQRGPAVPEAQALQQELQGMGAQVRLAACDVSQREAVAALLADLCRDAPLRAVFHCAGVAEDCALEALTPQRLMRVLRPKVDAAVHLHELTGHLELDAFVIFSSVAGVLGSPRKGNYAAANAFLDALAAHRQARGLTGQSLGWGLWEPAGLGMTAQLSAQNLDAIRRIEGIVPLTIEQGMQLLEAALQRPEAVLLPVNLDRAQLGRNQDAESALLRGLADAAGQESAAAGANSGVSGLRARLFGLVPDERGKALLSLVRAEAATVLGLPDGNAVPADQPLKSLGLDSLMAVELRRRLSAGTALALPASLVFDYPTPRQIVGLLEPGIFAAPAEASAAAVSPSHEEPIAVVAMACRFPGGVQSPEDYWRILAEGRDVIGPIPKERWDAQALYDPDPQAKGKSYCSQGGFLADIDQFDAAFFEIAPREAQGMDPQQRLVLQAAWELLERAGLRPADLSQSLTGVYIGASGSDYYPTGANSDALACLDGHGVTGQAGSVISGRVAYTLGLHGPAITVDTACSSSLVALHLACQALRQRECDLALAGGVAVMNTPALFVEFSRLRVMAPDGRCKSFSDSADGAGWSEGCGLVLLKRLSDARRDGDRVLALVRGSAVNQDGRSQGLTAPNGPAQHRVIRRALELSRLLPADIDAVEAHGTGTALGDPIEAGALAAVFGPGRHAERKVRLGSAKSNLGHTLAASGVAGVMKIVLALQHQMLPRTLHADVPTSQVAWEDSGLSLLQQAEPWPSGERVRRAGVSSFGISGTNAHIILEEAPPLDAPTASAAESSLARMPLVLSGKTPWALRAQAAQLAQYLEGQPQLSLTEVAAALMTTRTHFESRAAVVGSERSQVQAGLAALSQGQPAGNVVTAAARVEGKVVFVFPGQGSQWPRMAQALMQESEVFRAQIEQCSEALSPYLKWSLLSVLREEPGSPSLERIDVVQPVLFSVMVSLAAQWRSMGVVPEAVIGHSQGEMAAAYVAGALSLQAAARIVALRSQMLIKLERQGAIIAVELPVHVLAPRLVRYGDKLSIAAINGPDSCLVSGETAAADALLAELAGEQILARKVRSSCATHWAGVEPLREEVLTVLADAVGRDSAIPMYSTVTLETLSGKELTAPYWYQNLRQPVRFMAAAERLLDAGYRFFVEVSPNPVLTLALQSTLDAKQVKGVVVGTLRREQGDLTRMLLSWGELHCHGLRGGWTQTSSPGRRIPLPTYPFQRQRYWLDARVADGPPARSRPTLESTPHLYRAGWEEAQPSVPHASVARSSGVVLGGSGRLAERLGWVGYPDLDSLLRAFPQRSSAPELVLFDGTEAVASDLRDAVHLVTRRGLALLKSWLSHETPGNRELVWVTQGAVAAGAEDAVDGLAQAALWGLVRSARSEHPGRGLRLLDIESSSSAAELCAALAMSAEPELALRRHRVLVPRLRPAPPSPEGSGATGANRMFREAGTVLITGGTGELGRLVARHLVRAHGVRHLLLASRRGLTAPGAPELAQELAGLGAQVSIVACDVERRDALAALLAALPAQNPLSAVFHCSGAVADAALAALTDEALAQVLSPKVDPVLHLHELLGAQKLDAFVLYSSVAGVLGSPRKANYAAANVFLDALAAHRCARGLAGLSLAWGLWEPAGLGLTASLTAENLAAIRRLEGIAALSIEQGLHLLDAALRRQDAALVPVHLERENLKRNNALLTALLREPQTEPDKPAAGAGAAELRARLAGARIGERPTVLLELVAAEAAAVLGLPSVQAVPADQPLRELGLDSLMAVELRNRLAARLEVALPATLAFDYPTPSAIARLLLQRAFPELAAPKVESTLPSTPVSPALEEPIAIVAMACRLPGGVQDPEGLWTVFAHGLDVIGPFPDDRWDTQALYDPDPDAEGKSYCKQGGFLRDIDRFDPAFFGIAPREAQWMEPQQRLVLETTWEALERAGIRPAELNQGLTGVYIGASGSDYHPFSKERQELAALVGYGVTGHSSSVISGRVAYTLGLQGPAITVDTACSSSLVALHLACQALRQRECDLALAGGVQVLNTPVVFVEFSRLRGTAADGRCKSFSARADGAGWSEGCAVLLLKRLADARRDGDRVLALLRGTAVNQDGRSQGLTAPNGPAQQRVIVQALQRSGLTPFDLDAVEAHGTGTVLGDPIEAGALAAVFGPERPADRPLYLGSGKSNLGHTLAAAGAVGVMKVVLGLQHQRLPRTLHAEEPSPHVAWTGSGLSLLQKEQPWPRSERVRRAGVSSFGISGTNAHVIVEEAPDAPTESAAEPMPDPPACGSPGNLCVPWLLSGKTADALRMQAEQMQAYLEDRPQLSPLDVAAELATRRTHFEYRAAAVGRTLPELRQGLAALAGNPQAPFRRAATAVPKLAFLFSGQGSQRPAMGRALYEAYPSYREAVDAACTAFSPFLQRPLQQVLLAPADTPDSALLDQTAYTQPALFALQVGLFRLLQDWGVAPEFLLGHSLGELTAAHLAGVMSLRDACQLVAARSRLMQELGPGGAMVAVAASEQQVRAQLGGWEARVALAAVNGPSAVVLSGEEEEVELLARKFAVPGCKTTRLAVQQAFHSPRMDAMLEAFGQAAQRVAFSPPRIPIISNLTGKRAAAHEMTTPEYWVKQVRETVRFWQGMQTLQSEGVSTYLELGPRGVLSALAEACFAATDPASTLIVPLLRTERPEPETVLQALGSLHCGGHRVDWAAFFRPLGARRVVLPTYPFQRQRYWLQEPVRQPDIEAAGLLPVSHPLLGACTAMAETRGHLFTARLAVAALPWLGEHRIFEAALVPGAGLMELVMAAARVVGLSELVELTLETPWLMPAQGAVQVQLRMAAPDALGHRAVVLYSRPEAAGAEAAWTRHGQGRVGPASGPLSVSPLSPWPPTGAVPVPFSPLYASLAAQGISYGPAFLGLQEVYRQGSRLYARAALLPEHAADAARYGLHPALLDAALHAVGLRPEAALAATGAAGQEPTVELPLELLGVRLLAPGRTELRVRIENVGNDAVRVDLFDGHGEPVGAIAELRLRPANAAQIRDAVRAQPVPLYRVQWEPAQVARPSGARPRVCVLGRAGRLAARLGVEPLGTLDSLLAACQRGEPLPQKVLFDATETAGSDLRAAMHHFARQGLELLQRWLKEMTMGSVELIGVTQGAVAAAEQDRVPGLAQAGLWGLMRSARSEHPERGLRLVDLQADTPAALIWQALSTTEEPELAVRGEGLLAPRLRPVPGAQASGEAAIATPAFPPDGAVLLTGGTGALGRVVAQHLWRTHRVRRLVLASRRGPQAPGAQELQHELQSHGAEVKIATCDVSKREELEKLLREIAAWAPLCGVVHCAGVVQDGVLESLTPESLEQVLGPKVDAAVLLHELTQRLPLSLFVLFSSAAGVLGSPGQANYAAANALLDAISAHRKSTGLCGQSLAWGMWEPTGMGMTAQLGRADRFRLQRQGIGALSAAQGLQLLDAAMKRPEALLVPLRLEAASPPGTAVPALLRGLGGWARPQAPAQGLRTQLEALTKEKRKAALQQRVQAEAAAVLGVREAAVLAQRPFTELGLDSLMAVELRNRLAALVGIRLPATLAFDYPTVHALADRLWEQVFTDLMEPIAGHESPGCAPSGEHLELYRTLARIPLSVLQEAGLVQRVRELAAVQDSTPSLIGNEQERLAALDEETLIAMAFDRAEPGHE